MTSPHNGLDSKSNWISGISCHVGICVPDMAEAKKFYCGVLGFEEAWVAEGGGQDIDDLTHIPGVHVNCTQIMVPGGGRIELQVYTPLAEGRAKINSQGLNHLCFGVKDVWAEYERLKALGVKFSCEPKSTVYPGHPLDGYTCVYFQDPWGLPLELMAAPIDKGDDERPSGG